MDKKLVKELNSISKEIMKLSKVLDKMSSADVKAKKPKATKKVATVKLPAIETPAKASAADIVLEAISKSESGIDTAGLCKQTGFNAKKIQNIVFKLRKQGKIQNKSRGVFVSS